MLSRIAESLFWIGRYIERADGTASVIDAHLQLLIEDPWIDENLACRSLLEVMGASAPGGADLTRQDVLSVLAVDRSQPSSIASSLGAARENARRAREVVSTELWECLNTTRARTPRKVADDKVHAFISWVRERSALAVGIIESATRRDESWYFFTLGRSLERADMTARLLSTRSLTEETGPSWTTILRSCGAYESYLRTHSGAPSALKAGEFLILDRQFPRSILFSISRAEQALAEIEPRSDFGAQHESRRVLGQIRSELEYRPIAEILADLKSHVESVQVATSAVSEHAMRRYFPNEAAPNWVGGTT
ncbi:alpha-E domain-containing protein [Salinibacterium sp. SYSU T00001]|uniref:alpha-E domain-containing protein n=1 Tax=Homoserinimonas sedimenticola TaxID=2986805 RepID=UPI0022365C71|nr:alpha-E domain-containing protein [Salinibacterium sedimenticola]MCW4385866.1 alpha-E domain-containing protein [Salinibacterium sedimenticola]